MNKEINLQTKEAYISPDIEIVEIETEQHILLDASVNNDTTPTNNLDMENERW